MEVKEENEYVKQEPKYIDSLSKDSDEKLFTFVDQDCQIKDECYQIKKETEEMTEVDQEEIDIDIDEKPLLNLAPVMKFQCQDNTTFADEKIQLQNIEQPHTSLKSTVSKENKEEFKKSLIHFSGATSTEISNLDECCQIKKETEEMTEIKQEEINIDQKSLLNVATDMKLQHQDECYQIKKETEEMTEIEQDEIDIDQKSLLNLAPVMKFQHQLSVSN
ncbi:hypothetical protein C0J52_24482 [Blattella germanica]|nr:hypothetical protein C0J52_24482 [Blattella germanica]